MVAIQTACGELVVNGQNWNVDFSEGCILFGEKKYPIEFIGSESTSSNTWLWGWENINGFPEQMIQMAQQSKKLGEQWGLEPLTIAQLPLDDKITGHNLSIVACGLAPRSCYYRCPHSGGAAFVALSGVPEKVYAPVNLERFLSIVTQCIGQYQLDHRIFIESFLLWNATPYDWEGQTLKAHFTQELRIAFEQVNGGLRICAMDTQ